MRTMEPGDRVTLTCDAVRPRRVHLVVEVNDQGAWLREEGQDEGAFCIGAQAEHTIADDRQAVLW